MKKNKFIALSELKTPADFTDMLDLQDLKTQMTVLNHLQSNLEKYQQKLVLSLVKTPKQVISYIASESLPQYRFNGDFHKDLSSENIVEKFKEKDKKGKKFWIVDTKNFEIVEFPASSKNNMKFEIKGNILMVKDERVERTQQQPYYRIVYYYENHIKFYLEYNLDTNELIEVNNYSYFDYTKKHETW